MAAWPACHSDSEFVERYLITSGMRCQCGTGDMPSAVLLHIPQASGFLSACFYNVPSCRALRWAEFQIASLAVGTNLAEAVNGQANERRGKRLVEVVEWMNHHG